VTANTASGGNHSRVFWTLRVLETGLLVSALVGIVLFAWSIFDIVRIETSGVSRSGAETTASAAPASYETSAGVEARVVRELPGGAWPGIALFLGSFILLQAVRVILIRYRRDDGTQRDDAADAAARATAEALASGTTEPEPADEATALEREG
jgi:hypothetical protein